MVNQTTQTHKTGGIDSETPATIVLTDETVIDARDYFITMDGLVAVYLQDKQTGIDARLPTSAVRAILTSDEARAEFIGTDSDAGTSDDGEPLPRLFEIETNVAAGDVAVIDGDRWVVTEVELDRGTAQELTVVRDGTMRTVAPSDVERLYETAHMDDNPVPVNGGGQ